MYNLRIVTEWHFILFSTVGYLYNTIWQKWKPIWQFCSVKQNPIVLDTTKVSRMQTSHLNLQQQAGSRRKGCVARVSKQPFCTIINNLILSQLLRKSAPSSLSWTHQLRQHEAITRIKNIIKRKPGTGYWCHLPMVYVDCSGEVGSQQNNWHRLPKQLLSAFSLCTLELPRRISVQDSISLSV